MDNKISVVISTYNEEKNIERVIKSVQWANEVIVCDMYSSDDTVKIAKKLQAKVIYHKNSGFVEPTRNYAINKAKNEWVLVLDADEEVPAGLKTVLLKTMGDLTINYLQIPRKNLIFNKWMQAAMWWPDYHIRFFRKGTVKWSDKIHSKPEAAGDGLTLPAEEQNAIIHYHYSEITQFLDRLNRYTSIEADQLVNNGYKFDWKDLINKPLNEFLSRFFANKGFNDGLHGLALSLLQAFSFIIVYLKVWQKEGFKDQSVSLADLKTLTSDKSKEISYWFKYGNLSDNEIKRLLQRIKNKFL